MKFLDLFAGIGGFRLGMERAGHECVGYVEWDKYARKSYEAIHNTEGEFTAHDITMVTDNDIRLLRGKGIDVICGGFPCQSFSVAGKRGGFDDTRGTMFFEIARIAKQIKPRILLLENVKGLLSHDKGNTFGTILNTLDELGYDCEWQVLNSKNFGVPQNRERVFIIGHLRGKSRREVFPIGRTDTATNLPIEIIAHRKSYRRNTQVFAPSGITETLDTGTGGGRGHYTVVQEALNTTVEGDAFCINTGIHRYYFPSNVRRSEATLIKQTEPTLRIRKLTPKECWRLQSFPDSAFEKAQAVNSDSQLYKQAGNSVTVNVIYEIAKRL